MLERALRSLTAASTWAARKARSLGTGVRVLARRGRASGSSLDTASPQPRPEDAAFLNEVSETLRRIEASRGPAAAPPPRTAPLLARLRATAGWLHRLRAPVRRYEDLLLAAALLLGILAMVVHWRLSGSAHVPLQAPRVRSGGDAASMRPADMAGGTPTAPEVRAGGLGAGAGSSPTGLPR